MGYFETAEWLGLQREPMPATRPVARSGGGRAECGSMGARLFECHAAHDKDCLNDGSFYELTHRAPGSRRAAGSREMPRIRWQTIFLSG